MKERIRLQRSESADPQVARPEGRNGPSPLEGGPAFGQTQPATETVPLPKRESGVGHRFEQLAIHDRSRGAGGEGLPSDLRGRFEGSLGTDLSRVRIHPDPSPDSIPATLNAHAVTFGHNVHVRPDAYRAGTADGAALLAHEMVHVAQQATATSATTEMTAEPLEREAAALGPMVARGMPVRPSVAPALAPAASPATAAPAPAPTTAQPNVPADIAVQDAFNPMDKLHKLINAIDSSQVKMVPAEGKRGFLDSAWDKKRHIDYAAVVGVFTGLTPDQTKKVKEVYRAHEKRTLDQDLLEGGESGFESDLKVDQRHRLAALIGGTVVDRGASQPEKDAVAGRVREADAAELHELLHGSREKADVERVMRLLRRPGSENLAVAKVYQSMFKDASLGGDLGRLPFIQLPRAMLHFQGQHAEADRAAVDQQRARIAGIDEERAKLEKERAEAKEEGGMAGGLAQARADSKIKDLETARRGVVQEIEERLGVVMASTREAALSQGADEATARRAARTRGDEFLGGEKGVAAIGGLDAMALRAVLADDPVSKTVADLTRAHINGKLDAEMINAAVRNLRQEADTRVQAEFPAASASELEAKSRAKAAEYIARLKTSYAQVIPLWTFDQLVADTGSAKDAAVNQQLLQSQGRLSDVEELVAALSNGRKDLDTADRILKTKSAQELALLRINYFHRTMRWLDADLFGVDPTKAASEAGPPDTELKLRQEFGIKSGMAQGDARLRLEDYMQRPAEEGGLPEVMYLNSRAEREYEYAIENRGFTGWMRDPWGNEHRELLDETIVVIRTTVMIYSARAAADPSFAKSSDAHKMVETLRMARATIRGDRAEYEKANAALRSLLQSVAAFALQIALSAVLGPIVAAAGRLVQAAATVVRVAVRAAASVLSSTVATVGSNLVAFGNDYSLSMLKGDILGGLGGPIGPAAVGRLAKTAGGWLGKKLGGKVSNELLQLGKAVAGEGVELGKTAAGMKTGAWVQGEDVELSLGEILKARGMDIVSSKATDKLQKGLGLAEPTPTPSADEAPIPAPPVEPPAAPVRPTADAAPAVGGPDHPAVVVPSVAPIQSAPAAQPPTTTTEPVTHSTGVPEHIGPTGDANVTQPRPSETPADGVPVHVPDGRTGPSTSGDSTRIPVPVGPEGDASVRVPADGVPLPIGTDPTAPQPVSPYEKTEPHTSEGSVSSNRATRPTQPMPAVSVGGPPGRPVGMVSHPANPSHPDDAFRLYQEHLRADPHRETALLYNHVLDVWAVVQGDSKGVDIRAARHELGWAESHTIAVRHNHTIGRGKITPEFNQVPSGPGGDVSRIGADATKRPGSNWHAVDIVTAEGKPDRTWLIRDAKTGLYTVDFPDPAERGGRGRVSFTNVEQYQKWYAGRFGFEPKPAFTGGSGGPGGGVSANEPPGDSGPANHPPVDLSTQGTSPGAGTGPGPTVDPQPKPATPWVEPTLRGVGSGPPQAQHNPGFPEGIRLPDGTHLPKVEVLPRDFEFVRELTTGDKGINESIVLKGPGGAPGESKLWIFKPVRGEESMRLGPDVGIVQGERWRRAAAAAHLADQLGFHTPAVQLVVYNGLVGSLQEFHAGYQSGKAMLLNGQTAEMFKFWNSPMRQNMDAFDYFVGHQDRNAGNFMLAMDNGEPRLLLIDQDSTIPAGPDRSRAARDPALADGNGKPFDRRGVMRDIPATITADLAERFRALNANFPDVTLRQWLTPAEVDGLRQRLTIVVAQVNAGQIGVIGAP